MFFRMQLFSILLFLLSHVAMVRAVAGCHSDRDKDHRPRENCTAAGFSDIPAGFELSTQVLLFPNNLFSSLSWSSFQIFTNIYEIDLTGNKVPTVTSTVSPILPTLRVLRLGSNHLTSLSDSSFSACPGLIELYLENNAMDSLSDHTFSGLSKLEILDLSSNHIKVLPKLMLHPLPAIETLLLENNKITVMPVDWFSQKEEVPYLYLSANPWACSCSLDYLRRYLEDYEYNVYVRDGLNIRSDGESVVCDSPQWRKHTPVLHLEVSDLCSSVMPPGPSGDFYQPITTNVPYKIPVPTAAIPATSVIYSPPHPPPTTTTATTTHVPTTATTPPFPTTATTTPVPTITTTTATTPPVPTTATTPPFPTTATTTTTPVPTTTDFSLTSAATQAFIKELHTVYHRVVTWSWHQSFTRLIEWSNYSGSAVKSEVPVVESHTLTTRPTLHTVRPSTESPADMTTGVPKRPAETTKSVPSTVTDTTPKLQVVTTTTTIPSWVIHDPERQRRGAGGADVFCFWLFTGCLLLCVLSAVCMLATLVRLVIWYRRVYKPLSLVLMRRGEGSEGVRLLTYSRREETEVEGGGGVMALYRSVLFINTEGGEAMQKEGEGGGEKENLIVTLQPAGGKGGGPMREDKGERGEREEGGVYRKTLFRLLSKEEEIDGWRDVMEECRVSARDGGRRGGGKDEGMDRERRGGEVSKKRYSVILREEREEAEGGKEELDWVVGGWEVKRGGGEEEPRSSWGEWLAHYLPSMPWGVTAPPEGDQLGPGLDDSLTL